jgi:hypothetical protein
MRAPALLLAVLLAFLAPATARAQPADAPAGTGTRLIQISQIDGKGAVVGNPNEVACPASGCQTVIDLVVSGLPEPFLFSVEFVGQGAYVTLSPRSIATAEVQEWREGHTGPIFVPLRGAERQQVDMAFIVVRSATLRALEPNRSPDVLASGNVFNRRRAPDLTLRVSFSSPSG